VAWQATYDPYGQPRVTQMPSGVTSGFAYPRIGHKGLFVERLDTTTMAHTERLESNARLLYHARNRWLQPSLGRWTSRDPNGLGQTVQQSWAMHGVTANVSLAEPDIRTSWTDGANLQQYVRGNPVMGGDEMGLFLGVLDTMISTYELADRAAGAGGAMMNAVRATENFLDSYSVSLLYDIEWALDWTASDDENRRFGLVEDMTEDWSQAVGGAAEQTFAAEWKEWSPSRHGVEGAARPMHGAAKHDRMGRAWATHFARKFGDQNVRYNQALVDENGKTVSRIRGDVVARDPKTGKVYVIEVDNGHTYGTKGIKQRRAKIAKALGIPERDVHIHELEAGKRSNMPGPKTRSGGRRFGGGRKGL
jgi:hypothetical protein